MKHKINEKQISTYFGIAFFVLLILLTTSTANAFSVSSPFGWRIHPIKKQRIFHTGIDIPVACGSPVVAIFDGVVVFSESRRGYGNTVIIQHDKNRYTLYGHCSRLIVRNGQRVKAKETIALSGNSGLSTGPHLHLEYWIDGKYVDPMLIWNSVSEYSLSK